MKIHGPSPTVRRWCLGGLTTLSALAALVWSLSMAAVDYQFRQLPALPDNQTDVAFLTEYSLKLDQLLRRDPSNGEIRNRYASVLARQREYKRALDEHKRALATHNTHNSRFFTGDMYEKLQDYASAEHEMALGVIINPTDPKFNASRLRLLNRKLELWRRELRRLNRDESKEPGLLEARRSFARASRDWGVRAPHDQNSHLFLANYYVGPPLYPLQAYRCFLMGLSKAPYMTLNPEMMIEPRDALKVISDIIKGRWAKPYRDLP